MKRQISTSRASAVLAAIWLACFCLAILIVGILYFSGAIRGKNVSEILDRLSAIYAPYLGAMLVYSFVSRKKNEKGQRLNTLSFRLALATSLLWNLVVLCFLFKVLWVLHDSNNALPIDEALVLASDSGSRLSWIASPAIGYYFAKPSTASG